MGEVSTIGLDIAKLKTNDVAFICTAPKPNRKPRARRALN
jgi:hypothetical protein